TQATGGQGYWVGEGKPKPLTEWTTSSTTLEPLKVANIAVITDELLRDSSPSAEQMVRKELAAALRERLATDFIDPDKFVALKVAMIAVIADERLRGSSPCAEQMVRSELAAARRERLDTDFIDPDKFVAPNVSPASITNGVTPIASAGVEAEAVRADIKTAME